MNISKKQLGKMQTAARRALTDLYIAPDENNEAGYRYAMNEAKKTLHLLSGYIAALEDMADQEDG